MSLSHPHPGYAFIPLPSSVDRQHRPHATHDRRHPGTHSGSLTLTWLLEQPVHVGSGFKALVPDEPVVNAARSDPGRAAPRSTVLVRQHVRLGAIPCVPGSTLKGVLRARYEAITRSCATAPGGRHASRKSASSSFGSTARARLEDSALNEPAFHSGCNAKHGLLCPACALFGRLDLRSRLVMTDALPDTAAVEHRLMPAQFEPRLHHVGEFTPEDDHQGPLLRMTRLFGRKFAVGMDERPPPREERGKQPPAKQLVEAIPAGTHLQQEIRFLNLTDAELGGLLAVLGHEPKSRVKVGAGKCHGFGRALVEVGARTSFETCMKAFRADPGCDARNFDRLIALHGEDC